MTASDNTFGAAASAALYLYQARVALLRCIPLAHTSSSLEIAIEKLDDISFEQSGTPIELLQTKHHLHSAADLSDHSPELWKTLRVWAAAVGKDAARITQARLLLITTATADQSSIAYLLRSGEDSERSKNDILLADERLCKVASISKNKNLETAFSAYLALSWEMRIALLNCVELIDSQPQLADLAEEIEYAIRFVAPVGKAVRARELLEGWWWAQVCKSISCDPVATIPITAVEAKLEDIRESLNRDALSLDFKDAELSSSDDEALQTYDFVRQLKFIGIGKQRTRFAKRDFYRAFAQRSKWTREKVVLDDEISKFEKALIEEWEPRFERMCEECDVVEPGAVAAQGRTLFKWVEDDARLSFRSITERFLTVGSYHILANDKRVGWHRDYKRLLEGGC